MVACEIKFPEGCFIMDLSSQMAVDQRLLSWLDMWASITQTLFVNQACKLRRYKCPRIQEDNTAAIASQHP
jgi:hypothetical protein